MWSATEYSRDDVFLIKYKIYIIFNLLILRVEVMHVIPDVVLYKYQITELLYKRYSSVLFKTFLMYLQIMIYDDVYMYTGTIV